MSSTTCPESEPTSTSIIDTAELSKKVRHYLTYNQIQWSRFSTLVLGVSQSRLSTLLSKPMPWDTLTKRVQALYERMQLWMDTRATYGNNPYAKEKQARGKKKAKGKKKVLPTRTKKPRSLLEGGESKKMLKELEDYEAAKAILLGETTEVMKKERSDSLQEVVEECLIEEEMEGIVNDDQMMPDLMANNEEGISTSQARGGLTVEVGGTLFMYQLGGNNVDGEMYEFAQLDQEEMNQVQVYQMGEDQQEMQVCQVYVLENPQEPGTYSISVQEGSGVEGQSVG